MANKRILIISANGDEPTTGYATRVIQVAKTLAEHGHTVRLVRFYPFHHPRSWVKTLENSGIKLTEIPMPPMSRYALSRWTTVLAANLLTYLLAFFWRADALQAESHDAALIALWIKWYKIKVVVDIHGAAPEEAAFLDKQTNQSKDRRWLEQAEKLIVEKSDVHFVVSQSMIEHLKTKYTIIKSIARILPISVDLKLFPCTDSNAAKSALNIDPEKIVVAYCGGDQNYQCLTEMHKVLKMLSSIANLHILILSKSTQHFAALLDDIPCSKTYKSAAHHEVHRYLNAADYGFLIRRDELLNRVSCPTKFAEYLACGLAVITTPWAGHGPEIVEQNNAGIVIDPDTVTPQLLTKLLAQPIDRKRMRQIVVQQLSWSQTSQNLTNSYC